MTKDEALKMAIEALDYKGVRDSEPYWEMMNKALQACKEALADNPFCKHGVPRGVCTLGEKDCD
jgi:hypothetical protein